ncbi:MAG: hypothetical protein SWY16_02480 [Cyanobacteriota bacterium]|nr:hypothetical protein [Cyanobacteriota bacterium]
MTVAMERIVFSFRSIEVSASPTPVRCVRQLLHLAKHGQFLSLWEDRYRNFFLPLGGCNPHHKWS